MRKGVRKEMNIKKRFDDLNQALDELELEVVSILDLLKECARELYDKPVRELGGYQQKMEYLKNLIKRIEEKLYDKAD